MIIALIFILSSSLLNLFAVYFSEKNLATIYAKLNFFSDSLLIHWSHLWLSQKNLNQIIFFCLQVWQRFDKYHIHLNCIQHFEITQVMAKAKFYSISFTNDSLFVCIWVPLLHRALCFFVKFVSADWSQTNNYRW